MGQEEGRGRAAEEQEQVEQSGKRAGGEQKESRTRVGEEREVEKKIRG
jgi:hypothetical protein